MTDWNVSAYLCGDLHKKNKRSVELFSGRIVPEFVCGKAAPEMKDTYSDLGCVIYLKSSDKNVVEVLPGAMLSKNAVHPYTKALMDSIF